MRKWYSSFALGFVIILGILFWPNHSEAAVNDNDVNSVMNGLITQLQINQANKPQYSDHNGTSEMIDSASGKLVWKQTNIHLPGRDGLDLDIGVMYDSNYSFNYTRNYNSPGNIKKYNYLISRYDLGMGWSFMFPSIQLADGYMYYHQGDGAVYRIDFSSNDTLGSYTHLLGYQGKDLRLMQDTQGLFSNGQASSTYYLEYADKKREYFAADGRLLGIVDRYGNTIKFQHIDRQIYDGQSYKVISSITDTVGRTVTFTYDSTLQTTGTFNGEKIEVSVKDPSGNEKQKIAYMKSRSQIIFNGNPDGYAPFLWYIQDQNLEFTYFDYDAPVGYFHYSRKSYDSYSGWNSYFRLLKITSTNSYTNYQYDKVTRNLGTNGFGEELRVTSRNDQIRKNSSPSGDYNHLNYSYVADYTGYPTYYDAGNMPVSYSYSSKSTVQSSSPTNGLATTTTFNGKGQVTSTETKAANGERKVVSNLVFHPTFTYMPTKIQSAEYAVGDTDSNANKLTWDMQYTDWGGIQSETRPLSDSQYNDAATKSKYTTSYTYDPTYYFLKTKSTYQNSSTLLTETYDYYSNGRLKSYSNPKGQITSYCYEAIDASNVVTSNCTDPNAILAGKIKKIKTSKSLGNGQTSLSETQFGADTNYTYPSESVSYFTTKNSSGQTITQTMRKIMTYFIESGLLKDETDGNGNKTSYQYDALGRITKVTYPTFTNLNATQYDVSDEYSYSNMTIPASADSENASVSALRVNSSRKYTQKSNNAVTLLSSTQTYYDGLGLLRYAQESNGGTNQVTQYRTDDLSRVIYSIDPMNNTTTVSYDAWGNQNEALDVYGNLYISENNLKARRTTRYFVAAVDVQDYRNNPTQASVKSSYVEQDYDQWGQLITNRTYREWPTQNQPITELYSYDIVGNLVSYTDPKRNLNSDGVTNKYSYDALNYLTDVKDALGQITKYQYDANGQIISATMQSSESGAPQTLNTRTYNEAALLATKNDPANSQESYGYNNLGLLQQRTDRNGTVFTYQYDEQYRNTILSATGAAGLTQQRKSIVGSNGILYDTQEIHNNGTKSVSTVTGIDFLKRVTSQNVQSTNYASSLGLSYDLNGRITKIT